MSLTQDIAAMPFAPGGDGFFGHNGEFRNDRVGVLNRLAATPRPIMRLRLPFPGVSAIVVNDPDLVQEMMVEKGRIFDKSDMLRFSLYPLAGEGLFTSQGDLWKRQRRLMAPLFQPRMLERYAEDMVEASRRTIRSWVDGDEMPLLPETTRLTMSIAGKTLFDADTFTEADEIGHALTVALDWTGWVLGRPIAIAHVMMRRKLEDMQVRAPRWALPQLQQWTARMQGPVALIGHRGRELAEAIAILDDHVQRMIDNRRAGDLSRGDLLSRLLEAKDEGDGSQMSDRQVRDEVLTLFVAGHETTATALAWAAYLLSRNPAIRDAVEKEVDALDGDPTLADLPRLGLCLRVFKETLRIYPPVYMFGRDATEPTSLGGFDLPRRTNALVSPWAIHRLERLWDRPLEFDPDRFLPEREAARHRYAYIPFGAGPRICIGNHFAYMEAQLALAVILRRFRLESVEEDTPEPIATLRPKGGIRVRVIARQRAHSEVAAKPAAVD